MSELIVAELSIVKNCGRIASTFSTITTANDISTDTILEIVNTIINSRNLCVHDCPVLNSGTVQTIDVKLTPHNLKKSQVAPEKSKSVCRLIG